MKKTIITMCMIFALMISVGLVVASAKNQNQKQDKEFKLPKHAVEVAPGVFYLGKAFDKGKVVEGYAFMAKDKKRFVKPGTVCGNGICEPGENARKCPEDCNGGEDPEEPDTSSCYGFLSKGAKWKTVEPYIVNTTNSDGLSVQFVRDNLADNILKWETSAGVNILGDEDLDGTVDIDNIGNLNYQNEVMFGDINQENVIAMAIIWGTFSAPPPFRELVEWDMIFDDVDFDWSEDCLSENCTNRMDFENIATHELGHAVGLGDLYNDECSEQTMYGYASYGETKKRDLASGDIAGISSLY